MEQTLCVNPDVRKLHGVMAMNDRCRELQQNKSKLPVSPCVLSYVLWFVLKIEVSFSPPRVSQR